MDEFKKLIYENIKKKDEWINEIRCQQTEHILNIGYLSEMIMKDDRFNDHNKIYELIKEYNEKSFEIYLM